MWWILGAIIAWILQQWFYSYSEEDRKKYQEQFVKFVIDATLDFIKKWFEEFYDAYQKNKQK